MSKVITKVDDGTVVANVENHNCFIQIATLGDIVIKNVRLDMTRTELVKFAEQILEAVNE